MIEMRLIGHPEDIDAALAALAKVAEVHRGRRKPARGTDGQIIQYGAIRVLDYKVGGRS